ncbi:hypothetical protein LSUB1_G002339 [Lachnellula subtilissima]|uniref:BTB domain-containing protein n=1 Tax=Lachnellula subtilissima TaxID=602034 RepID=A0A8H8S0B1_9HELO|nr:hypothetical protein LSUB1_G002339 [Lachnellula subtilissima]
MAGVIRTEVADKPAIKPLKPSQERVVGNTPFLDKVETDMVDILVGPKKKLFRVHKTYLCRRIPYFDKMFNGAFKEAGGVAELPEDDPAAFDLLMEWTYCPNPRRLRDLVPITDSDKVSRASWDVVAFYALATKLCLPDLQDIIMNSLIRYHKRCNELPSIDFVSRAWVQAGEDSRLCDYCLQSLQWVLAPDAEQGVKSKWPTIEVVKLFQDHPSFNNAYINLGRSDAPEDPREIENMCYFHAHGVDEECPPNHRKRKNLELETSEGQVLKRAKVGHSSV